jgi:hypothetical protein
MRERERKRERERERKRERERERWLMKKCLLLAINECTQEQNCSKTKE